MRIKTISYVTASVFSAFLVQSLALAQQAPNAGSILRDQQTPALTPPKVAPAIQVEEPVRPALKPGAVRRFTLNGLRISGNTVFAGADLLATVNEHLGKQVDFADLEKITARITRYYRERGYLVARAYLPEQKIVEGVVDIAVLEGRFGKVDLNNRSSISGTVIERYTGYTAFPGAEVVEVTLERKLLLLNDLAGVGEARARMRPGARAGESDLVIGITPGRALDGSIELDNHGNRFIGEYRVTGKINLYSPLGQGDLLSGQFTKGVSGLDYGRLSYQLPVGGDGFKFGAAISHTNYRLGKNFAALDANGASATYNLNASYPFIRTRNLNLYGAVAFEHRDFRDNQGAIATQTGKSTQTGTVSINGDLRDAWLGGGVSLFSIGYGSGRLNIASPGALLADATSARTHGGFNKLNVNAMRLQSLGDRLSASLSVSGQKASKNLDSSEKFVLGGANGVRAYPQGEASGDSGYLAVLELRYALSFAAVPGILQPFAFVDAGGVTINENPFAAAGNTRSLTGGGLGLLWARGGDFQVKLTAATRLGNEKAVSDTDRRVRGWLQAIKSF